VAVVSPVGVDDLRVAKLFVESSRPLYGRRLINPNDELLLLLLLLA